jgi:hypothetical protein
VNKGHPALDMVARDITREEMGSTWLKNIIQTMREELGSQEDGVAIAAPQIGESIRMFVISPTAFHKNTKHFQTVYINPKEQNIQRNNITIEIIKKTTNKYQRNKKQREINLIKRDQKRNRSQQKISNKSHKSK